MSLPASLPAIDLVSVFPAVTAAGGKGGGNPAPIVLAADGLDEDAMRAIAARYGHEAGFVLRPASARHAWHMRFFVPLHEMEMCGHATVGALWCLRRAGQWNGERVTVQTASGDVFGEWADGQVRISQPAGRIEPLSADDVASVAGVLGIAASDIRGEVLNASTSRVKTLVRLGSVEQLDQLAPDFAAVGPLCERIGSTGLYPYAVVDDGAQVFSARQFPKSSGYPEDAATGIAAAALVFGLLAGGLVEATGRRITVRQGWAMGRPSEIELHLQIDNGLATGCWLGGAVVPLDSAMAA